jgi:ABC-2 type transport system permease protein
MTGALHAEWTKLRTVAGPAWLLVAAATLTAGLSWLAVTATTCPAVGCTVDATKLSLTGVQLGQAVIAVLAVLAVGTEYSTGMILTTLTAMPHRIAVLAAKATVLTGGVLVAGVAGVLGSVLAGRLALPGQGFTVTHGYRRLSLADAATLRAAGGSVLYLALIALLSLGIATLVRDSAAAIGVILILKQIPHVLGHDPDPEGEAKKTSRGSPRKGPEAGACVLEEAMRLRRRVSAKLLPHGCPTDQGLDRPRHLSGVLVER